MKKQFSVTRAEIKKEISFFLFKKKWWIYALCGLYTILSLFVLIDLIFFDASLNEISKLVLLTEILLVIFLTFYTIKSIKIIRNYLKIMFNNQQECAFEIEFDKIISVHKNENVSKCEFGEITKCFVNKKYLIMVFNRESVFFIPKQIFATNEIESILNNVSK